MWLLAMAASLVAAPDYTIPVSLALLFAAFHFGFVTICLRGSRSKFRFLLLLLAVPLFVVTLDNLGRLSYNLGGPLFRILI